VAAHGLSRAAAKIRQLGLQLLRTPDRFFGPEQIGADSSLDHLSRVLSDYGLIVAGWSVQRDHTLREAIAAQHNPHFTTGWVAPGELSEAAQTLVASKQALLLPTTADDAFGHLTDQIDAMRNRRARHPLSAAVAVSRIKRELAGLVASDSFQRAVSFTRCALIHST